MQHYFALIEDPRHPGYVKHKLGDILTIVMCAVLCGMDKLCDIIAFAQNKTDFFKTHFTIEDIPSKPTFSRVLAAIDGQKVAETIISLMKEQLGTKGDVIAVDGKAIRSTVKAGNSRSTLQIITAYLTESGVVLGQEAIHEKTNEIPVLQQMLLSYLNVKGKTVTVSVNRLVGAKAKIELVRDSALVGTIWPTETKSSFSYTFPSDVASAYIRAVVYGADDLHCRFEGISMKIA